MKTIIIQCIIGLSLYTALPKPTFAQGYKATNFTIPIATKSSGMDTSTYYLMPGIVQIEELDRERGEAIRLNISPKTVGNSTSHQPWSYSIFFVGLDLVQIDPTSRFIIQPSTNILTNGSITNPNDKFVFTLADLETIMGYGSALHFFVPKHWELYKKNSLTLIVEGGNPEDLGQIDGGLVIGVLGSGGGGGFSTRNTGVDTARYWKAFRPSN